MRGGVAGLPCGMHGLASPMLVQGLDVVLEAIGIAPYMIAQLVKIGRDRGRHVDAEYARDHPIFHRFQPGSRNVLLAHRTENSFSVFRDRPNHGPARQGKIRSAWQDVVSSSLIGSSREEAQRIENLDWFFRIYRMIRRSGGAVLAATRSLPGCAGGGVSA